MNSAGAMLIVLRLVTSDLVVRGTCLACASAIFLAISGGIPGIVSALILIVPSSETEIPCGIEPLGFLPVIFSLILR